MANKTLIINDNIIRNGLLRESILIDSIPDDIMSMIDSGSNPLGNNDAIPNIIGAKFTHDAMQSSFEKAVSSLKSLGHIDTKKKNLESALNEIVLKCQKIESQNRDRLEKICMNYLIDLFSIPQDSVNVTLNLVDTIEIPSHIVNVDKIKFDDFSYENSDEPNKLILEINKRRMLDIIAMGAGLKFSSDIKSYISEIYDIDPKLPDLYRQFILINNYLLFTKEDFGISDQTPNQLGVVTLQLGGQDDMPVIDAKGMIFPVLLCEAIRGFFELFASHGLPDDLSKAKLILLSADYLKAEPWDMRIGEHVWNKFSENFTECDREYMPYVLKIISMQKPKMFNKIMKEFFLHTKLAERIAKKITEKAKKEKENDSFSEEMPEIEDSKGLITDEYMQINEF